MKALFDKLNEWGCDVTSALERCMDDELYIVCLEKFTRDDSFDLLKNKIKEQDYASVFQYAHRLKGVANNLGLMPIAVEFSIIMNLTRLESYKEIDNSFLHLEIKWQYLCQLLEEYL